MLVKSKDVELQSTSFKRDGHVIGDTTPSITGRGPPCNWVNKLATYGDPKSHGVVKQPFSMWIFLALTFAQKTITDCQPGEKFVWGYKVERRMRGNKKGGSIYHKWILCFFLQFFFLGWESDVIRPGKTFGNIWIYPHGKTPDSQWVFERFRLVLVVTVAEWGIDPR